MCPVCLLTGLLIRLFYRIKNGKPEPVDEDSHITVIPPSGYRIKDGKYVPITEPK